MMMMIIIILTFWRYCNIIIVMILMIWWRDVVRDNDDLFDDIVVWHFLIFVTLTGETMDSSVQFPLFTIWYYPDTYVAEIVLP